MDTSQLDQPVAIHTPRRLSPTQRAFLASQLRHPLTTSMNMTLVVTFDKPLDGEPIDIDRLVTACDKVLAGADVFRTRIERSATSDRASLAPELPLATQRIQLDRSAVADWTDGIARQTFDLSKQCFSSFVADHGDSATWCISAHHLVIDATSYQLLVERIVATYLGEAPPRSDFYPWVDSLTASADRYAKQASYWEARPPAPRPGRVYRQSDRTTSTAHRIPLPLTTDDHQSLATALASQYRLLSPELSLAGALVTATAVYLHRLTGADNFAIGIPVHHRNDPATAGLIGPTLGVYPVDITIESGDTFATLHRRVARQLMTTLGNANPGVSPPGDYDAVVNVIPNVVPDVDADLGITTQWIHPGAIDPEHVLRIQATGYGDLSADAPLALDLDLHDQVADPDQRNRAPHHLLSLMRGLSETPDASIYDPELLSEPELERVASVEVGADFDVEPASVVDRLRSTLQSNAQVVIEHDDIALTGNDLWQWATSIAADLVATTEPGARVGIELGPSIEAVAAIYGCLLAGRPFVPLDPEQPAARKQSLTQRAGVARTFVSVEQVQDLRSSGQQTPAEFDEVPGSAEAYLLFTSGSSGVPKGVPITHLGLSRYLQFATQSYFPDGLVPVAPLFTALTFDLTITSIFGPILAGGRLVTFAERGPAALAAIAARDDLNWCKATPSHLEVLVSLAATVPTQALSIQALVVGGEAFRSDLAARLLARNPSIAIFNEYGPTEAVVGCMIHRVDPATNGDDAAVPIGLPAPGVELRIVDQGGRRVPIGAPGELLIASQGVTQGYLAAADAPSPSNSPFVELDGTRFYRSGDLVVRDESLTMTYLGRIDEQVKVGGIRLDPAEVEHALMQHPAVAQAAVRVWTPSTDKPTQHCVRCGLPSNVPNVVYDDAGVCSTCHAFDQVAPAANAWFRNEDDLVERLRRLNHDNDSDYDCLHLLSGGKDSTYALYRLVDLGFRPYALTLDNGFISEAALENCRIAAADLGIDHDFVTTPQMNAIFRDSLITHSDVCHGCYKTIYTLATNRAVELGIPAIVTGLSRGQLFETRLIPGQFQQERFDPDAIDRAVVEARKRYHRTPDFTNRVLDTSVFETDDIFENLEYVDIYRYLDVELTEVLRYLAENTKWERPPDTGRSSNCLINIAGIHAHQIEQGYHNYAEPYAWDVRLGHKQRAESMAELDDPVDPAEIADMLEAVGYQPAPKQVLTGWFRTNEGERAPTPAELRSFLADRLPHHAIPTAFVQVDEIPTTANGKLDHRSLDAPDRQHRAAIGAYLEPSTELEAAIVDQWERLLGLAPISANDDFFALGGDSLAAVTMIVGLGDELGLVVPEELAFSHTTPRELASAISAADELPQASPSAAPPEPVATRAAATPPALSQGELSLLFHQQSRPDDVMYNVGRTFHVEGAIATERFRTAVQSAAARHEPLTWSYGSPRVMLSPDQAVDFEVIDGPTSHAAALAPLRSWQRAPFDLDSGPLLRCRVMPLDDGTTLVAVSIHHVSGDHGSLDQLWVDIDHAYQGRELAPLTVGYSDFCGWQRDNAEPHRQFWSERGPYPAPPDFGMGDGDDGYLTCNATAAPEQLRTVAGRTPVATAVAAAAAAVAPYFDEHVEVNLVSSTRDHDVACDLVGYLLNPLPLTLSVGADQSVLALTATASETIGQCLRHRAYPFAEMVADANSKNQAPPTGRVLVSYSDDPAAELAGVPVSQRMLFNGSAVADVSFFVEPRADHINLGVEYRGSRVSHATAELLLRRFDQAFSAALANEARLIRELDRGPHSVLVGPELDDHELVLDRFLQTVRSDGTAVAIEVDGTTLTRAQVHARACQVAQALIDHGVTPGERVAVRVSRSVELPVAILGTWLAGASYVPLDPSYPADRIASSIEHSGAAIELTDQSDTLAETAILLSAGQLGDAIWDDDHPPLQTAIAAAGEAYVIFTSGSTGVANGVPIRHDQLAASTAARSSFYDADPTRFLMVSSVAFDSSIVGLFWSLASGGTLVLPSETDAHDIDALAALAATSISHLLCVPTLYDAMLDRRSSDQSWPAHIIVAGEACTPRLVARHFHDFPDLQLTNEYGPTEATVWATAHHCSPADTAHVPIGPPIAGTWLAIVGSSGQVVPEGVEGQLILGGPNVASGYLGDRQADRFTTHEQFQGLPPSCTGPAFRTGDACKVVGSTVLFAGRVDDQLNVGGARVEPQEIESAVAQLDAVTAVVVVAVDTRPLDVLLASATQEQAAAAMRQAADTSDPQRALATALQSIGRADYRLVAHYASQSEIPSADLRAACAALPTSHRPSIFSHHQELPQLPNGKLDRSTAAHLPLPAVATSTTAGVGATPAMQQLFAEVLHLDSVGVDQSFFDLGGDSLRALELLRLIEARTGARLPTSAVHNAPTPAELAILSGGFGASEVDAGDNTIVMRLQPEGSQTPIFALHNLGVDGAMWRPMSGYLGNDHPMYGIADPFALLDPFGDNYNLEHRPEIHETAARYVDHIERLAPTGPIVLLGFCLGGVFGYEVAQQLQAKGRTVENFIIVLDWHAPHLEYEENWITLTKLSYRRSGKSLTAHVMGVLTRRAFLKSIRRRLEGYAVKAATRLRLPLTERLQARQYVEEGIHRIHSYKYLPYDGRITVVRSTEDPRIPTNLGTAGWGDLVADLEVDYVPGVGEKMLYEPFIGEVTEVVRRALRPRS